MFVKIVDVASQRGGLELIVIVASLEEDSSI